MFDKFHDECGVVAIYGHPEAAKLAYLGLYALQHRGQESAGICTSDGGKIHCHKSMGHVADIFTSAVLAELPGELAIGHTRYSTAGDTVLLNAQPFSVACNKGRVAVAHNGNITNAAELRARTGAQRLHLSGHQRYRSDSAPGGALLGTHAGRRAARRAAATGRRVFAGVSGRGPHHRGARPARLPPAGGGRNGNFRRPQVLRVRLGNLRVRSDRRGLSARRGARRNGDRRARRASRASATRRSSRARSASSSTSIFRGPDSIVFGRPVEESRENLGRLLARECPADADIVVPVPDSGVAAAIGYSARIRPAVPPRADPQPLRGPHVHRAIAGHPRFRRQAEAQPGALPAGRQARGAGGRFASCAAPPAARSCAWCAQAGAREVHLRISCPPTISPCFYGVDTPTKSELIASNHNVEEIRRFVEADSVGYLSLASLRKAVGDSEKPRILLRLLHGRLSHRAGEHRRVDGQPAGKALVVRIGSNREYRRIELRVARRAF